MRTPDGEPRQWPKLEEEKKGSPEAQEIHDEALRLQNEEGLSPEEIRTRMRKWAREKNPNDADNAEASVDSLISNKFGM